MSYYQALSAFLLAALLIPSLPEGSLAAKNVAIQATYAFPYTISDFEGCQRAIAKAKSRALEKACGTFISGGSSRFKNEEIDSLNLFFFEMVGGMVTSFDVNDREVSTLYSDKEAGNYKQCSIDTTISVACDIGTRDTSFAADFPHTLNLNNTVFRHGEDFRINLMPSSDMYLFVFQYSPYVNDGDNVFQIYPNEIETDNFIVKDKKRTIPNVQSIDKYTFLAELPDGKDLAAEAVMAVALKKQTQFPTSMTVEEFHRLLSQIPLGQRRETMISYQIIQSKSDS